MLKLLATSTAARPTGSPPQRRLFRVQSGPFVGRLAALYADSENSIALKYSDYPYQTWSAAQAIASDSHDSPFSACIDKNGNIFLAYTDTGLILKMRKLTFSGGQWNVGSANAIINVDETYRPVIFKDGDDKLWCLFDHFRVSYDGRHYVRAKNSTDEGATWGSGPGDLGTALSAAWIDPVYATICVSGARLYAVYCVNRSSLKLRICTLSDSSWQAESSIVDLNNVDDRFDAAISTDGRLGVVITPLSGNVYFKEFDGLTWGGLVELETATARSPQIAYSGSSPQIIYSKDLGNGHFVPRYCARSGDSFEISNASPSIGEFDKVLVFALNGSPQFEDKTSAAANTAAGDVYHSGSQGLLDSVGDCLYLGKLAKFNKAAVVLSTSGIGGVVVWEFWNGVSWVEFTPHSGAFHFDSPDNSVYLWQDLFSAPASWQIVAVYGTDAYWVRARVTTGFATNPVGTQLLAGSKIDDMAMMKPDTGLNGVSS